MCFGRQKLAVGDPEAPWYGLIAGTCADPEEATTAYMLNAYNAAGLGELAQMLEAVVDSEGAPATGRRRRNTPRDCERRSCDHSLKGRSDPRRTDAELQHARCGLKTSVCR